MQKTMTRSFFTKAAAPSHTLPKKRRPTGWWRRYQLVGKFEDNQQEGGYKDESRG